MYETAEDAGLGLVYELGETLELSAGYLAAPANEPTEEGGIFNAPYGAIAQIILSPSDRLDLALTYKGSNLDFEILVLNNNLLHQLDLLQYLD